MDVKTAYDIILKNIEEVMGSSATMSNQLDKFCKRYFGSLFIGVFPSDNIPELKSGEMCILNLDKSSEPGSHWVSYSRDEDKYYFYDSFGRKPRSIIYLKKRVIYDRVDKEQNINEENCGQRCIAYLIIGNEFGFDLASGI